jgi:hypothetical protein
VYITVAATNSPAQRDAIRPAAVKRSVQPIRHANRRAQAAAVIRDFTSPPLRRSPLSFGDAFKKVKDGVNKGVDTVANGVDKAVDTVSDGVDKAIDTVSDGAGKAVNATGNGLNQAGKGIGKIVDSTTGEVLDFVDSVRVDLHRMSPPIGTDHGL